MSTASKRPLVFIHADESCIGNGREGDNPGGAGGLVEYKSGSSGRITRRDYWAYEPATTNNRMALRSVIEAFNLLSKKNNLFDVVFISDSQYLIKGLTEWVFGWSSRGWRRKGGAIENLELWWDAIRAVGEHRVMWGWVRGHDGHAQNSYADFLATRAAELGIRSDGLVESTFDSWFAQETDAGRLKSAASPFPSPENFRPSRKLPTPPGSAGEREQQLSAYPHDDRFRNHE